MLIWLHIGFREKIRASVKNVGFLVIYTTYFEIATLARVGTWMNVVSWLVIYVWCIYRFSRKPGNTLARYIISVMGMGLTQVLSLEVLYYIVGQGGEVTSWKNYICANLLSILISAFVYVICENKSFKISNVGNYVAIVLAYATLIMIFIKYDYERYEKAYSDMYMYLFGLLVILVLVVFRVMKINYQLEQHKYEIELRNEYEETYSKLIMEMRRKQHDYKNQITALYSVRFAEGISENDWNSQRSYGDQLLATTALDELILNINNPVLAGYFYTVCNRARRLGIYIKPIVNLSKDYGRIELHIIVEMLGILISNATEYLENCEQDEKLINVYLSEENKKLTLVVENTAEYIPYKMIEEMFELGYSTKGDNRGLGMYSLKKIVENYKGDIIVENIGKLESNWLHIKIVM